MTDSMKFGPEWLRNMSADSPNNTGLSNINTGGNNNNCNLSNFIGMSSNNQNNSNNAASHIVTPRYMFPEFRYGREEMLSCFDKNCSLPEILPSYKKLFVVKVQYPLALTPSTDEEMVTQGSALPTQRPAWIQRSPVGFSSATRGTTGRGGSVDRGRMRGKSAYHPIYHRPTAMFEDDSRPPSLKSERSWSERNGAGDALGSGVNVASDWNGTPSLSPRKEFSSHPRNLENWRRNRNEDGSGDASSGGAITNTDGWRGSSGVNSYGGAHRWGRSTSWRDDDSAAPSADGGGYGGSGVIMQRSYSTISTSNVDRSGYAGGNTSKNSENVSYGGNGNQSLNRPSGLAPNSNVLSARNPQWSGSCPGGAAGSYSGDGGSTEGEDNLPEWAMENPSDGGGTFDASGAFHGSIDEDSTSDDKEQIKQHHKKSTSSSSSSIAGNENVKKESNDTSKNRVNDQNHKDDGDESSSITEGTSDDKSAPNKTTSTTSIQGNSEPQNIQQNEICEIISNNAEFILSSNGVNSNTSSSSSTSPPSGNIPYQINEDAPLSKSTAHEQTFHSDYSDRMKEVADDMVEKLIMDDESIGGNNGNVKAPNNLLTTTNDLSAVQNVFVSSSMAAILKQSSRQAVPNTVTVSPTLPSLAGCHKPMPLYGTGVVVDHSTLQQHHLQQQQMAAAVAVTSVATGLPHSATELWYYRDPQTNVQGPFTAIEMTEWYRAGYFNENLYVRRLCDNRFRALGELIKLCHGNMPFTNSHLIPTGLDNMQMSNLSTIAQTTHEKDQSVNDFGLKQQQNEQREELKGNVTAAADSISSAVKNLNAVDMSHMVNMHFQMLQEQYIREQELMILAELSKNDCFQRLTMHEREVVVRQKIQILGIPEYLTNLAGLSNSLATLNLTAGNHLYDIIAECSKKDNIFANGAHQQQQQHHHHPQQQQMQQHQQSTYLDANDFILNAHQQKQQSSQQFRNSRFGHNVENNSSGKIVRSADELPVNDMLHDFNLNMFLRGVNANAQQPLQATPQQKAQDFISTVSSNDFLTEQQLLSSAAVTQNSMIQSWIPQLGVVLNNSQSQMMSHQQAQNQWSGGPLVGIPSPVLSGTQTARNAVRQMKPMSATSIWNTSSVDPNNTNAQINLEHNVLNKDNQQVKKENQQQLTHANEKHLLGGKLQHKDISIKNSNETEAQMSSLQHQQQQKDTEIGSSAVQPSTTAAYKQQQLRKDEPDKQLRKDEPDKQQSSNKRNNTKTSVSSKLKDDNGMNNKKLEEERRREIAEEKRRQKEEKRRLLVEEEKRRLQQIEDEKRRQIQEEKERQQQIQAQRRKAMLSNIHSYSDATTDITNATTTITLIGNKTNKDQQRSQSSIAPWSTQTTAAANKTSPCLAEIQKAERRERRADQQRQLEILEKQLRANAAASDANDLTLTWNASPVPVKSFAEIQAEEAKQLASEQLEMQRRKEQEQQNVLAAANVSGLSAVTSGMAVGNISCTWGSNKVWGSTSTSGFWEEPIKFSATVSANNSINTAIAASNLANSSNKSQSQSVQQKSHVSGQQPLCGATLRNLRKSQTVSVMQNATTTPGAKNAKYGINIKQTQGIASNSKHGSTSKAQQQGKTDIATGGEKKTSNKNQSSTSAGISNTLIKNDYENEFTGWCTKSLNNMNTKVDVPTFVTFLRDLESPYEVKDYIRMYLGESKEYLEFAKHFLERRSKYKNLQRAQNAHNDDMCKPAPAITPSGNDNSDNKGKSKKVKKTKMTKLDARILGFSVTAAEGRIVGARDYGDAP